MGVSDIVAVSVGGTLVTVGASVGGAWVAVLHAVKMIIVSTTKNNRMVFIFIFFLE